MKNLRALLIFLCLSLTSSLAFLACGAEGDGVDPTPTSDAEDSQDSGPEPVSDTEGGDTPSETDSAEGDPTDAATDEDALPEQDGPVPTAIDVESEPDGIMKTSDMPG